VNLFSFTCADKFPACSSMTDKACGWHCSFTPSWIFSQTYRAIMQNIAKNFLSSHPHSPFLGNGKGFSCSSVGRNILIKRRNLVY